MKKFYFFMMALLVSLSSMAWTVKFTNPDNWDQVAVYTFGPETEGTWPGSLMTQDGDVWTYEGTGEPGNIIFNNNNKGSQTGNLTFVAGATYDMQGVLGAAKETYTVYFDNSKSNWEKVYVYTWTPEVQGWPGIELSKNADGLYEWAYEATSEPSFGGFLFNNGVGSTIGDDKTADLTYEAGKTYNLDGLVGGGDTPVDPDPVDPDPTDALYIIGEPAGAWAPNVGIALEGKDGVYTYEANFAKQTYFGFAAKLAENGADWDVLNANRYGSAENDQLEGGELADTYTITAAGTYTMGFPNSTSFNLPEGMWTLNVNPTALTLEVIKETTGIESIEAEEAAEAVYYNLQGVRVANPENGLYIRVAGKTASKVFIR